MVQRAYSVFEIKAVDEEQRIIEGIATTPSTDRYDDIVEPKGAEFTLPIPFLWQHRHDSPIGHVIDAKVEDSGIRVRIQVERDEEPGPLRDLLNLAWSSIKKKLVRGLSIGFQSIESSEIDGSWGRRFLRWDWLELSAVTIPANAEATITSVKSHANASHRAVRLSAPVVSGASKQKAVPSMKTAAPLDFAEQVAANESTRTTKTARMLEIQKEASEAGSTKDPAQREEFETLRDEIKSLDAELADLRVLADIQKDAAKPVNGKTAEEGTKSRDVVARAVVHEKRVPAGVRFAQVARVKGLAFKHNRDVVSVARDLYPDDGMIERAAIAAGTTSHATWGKPLVGDESTVFADFVEFLRPQLILGKFGVGNIPSLRAVPFRTRLVGQTSGGAANWVGEGQAKGITKFDFAGKTLDPLKIATIAVISEELLTSSSPSADVIIRDQLAAAIVDKLDFDFIRPANNGSAASPASVTYGVVPVTSSGATAANVRNDIQRLVAAFLAAHNSLSTGVLVMPTTRAMALGMMTNPLGQPEFPNLGKDGGTLLGLPVIVSEQVPTTSAGSIVALLNAQDIYLGDEGGIAIDVSREASLEMSSTPTMDGGASPPVPAQVVSLWQNNLVGFRAERTINWDKRRDEAVQVLNEVLWGEIE